MEELMHAEQSVQAPVPCGEGEKEKEAVPGRKEAALGEGAGDLGGSRGAGGGRLSCGAWARLPAQGCCIRR